MGFRRSSPADAGRSRQRRVRRSRDRAPVPNACTPKAYLSPPSDEAGEQWTVTVDDPGRPMQLTGISNVAAASLRTSLTSTLARHRYIAGLRRAFTDGTALIQGWSQALEQEQRSWEHRWWPRELIAAWQASKPDLDDQFQVAAQASELTTFINDQLAEISRALAWWRTDLARYAATRNESS